MGETEWLVREIQKGLLRWYDFQPDSIVLYIGNQEEALAEMLREFPLRVVCADDGQTCEEKWQREYQGRFDYIVSVETLERQADPEQVLGAWRGLLKEEGKLLLGMNNRFGIRYFCGDRDPYTERNFDGIEGYRRAYAKETDQFRGRCYSRAEIRQMLSHAGWQSSYFFSVLPDLKNPTMIYGEDYLPREDMASRLTLAYNCPDTVFLEEINLYDSLIKNGMFHQMANAYLAECSFDGEHSDVLQVTCSMERGKENGMLTIIRRSGVAEKRAAYPEGQKRLEKLLRHGQDLAAHGVPVVEARIEDGVYIMPYVDGEVAHVYLKRLLHTDKDMFLREMDRFRDLILKSSEKIETDGTEDGGENQGVILRRGYLEMVPLNCFHKDGEFIFYDQEFCEENYPANMIIARVVSTLYAKDVELQKILPADELYGRYGLLENLDRWRRMEWRFLAELRREKELRHYHGTLWCDGGVLYSNRQRMNYSEEKYRRLFIDIFRNADTRKLILFGSGRYAKKFLALYGRDYPVYAVIDNCEANWGMELEGITIQSPELLRQLRSGEYKVLVCIKNYLSVMKQLEEMGVTEYSIFDAYKDYPRKRKPASPSFYMGEGKKERKKYHTGYISGVFDLFHIGHLNMFKRAKEQCEYLIVGVVTDEGVRKFKGIEPFIPFEERIEMVRSCRYVDEAVDIPLNYRNTEDAFRLYHFDCQFAGSDYMDNPDWLAGKRFLEAHGSEMVFFPYTEGTSSTKIKTLIEKGLM